MTRHEQEALRRAIRQLERARDVGHEDDHPVTAAEVALVHADQAVGDPERYYMKKVSR